jgi:hypothetical protein
MVAKTVDEGDDTEAVGVVEELETSEATFFNIITKEKFEPTPI